MTVRDRWSPPARRLGLTAAAGLCAVGALYLTTIALWLVLASSPREPIPDPYLAVMEVLTMASALLLVGLAVALHSFADPSRRLPALATLVAGSTAAGLTWTVHVVQLTAVRQLWQRGSLPDYRLVWPSPLFAVEYFAWDVLVGFTMCFAGLAVADAPGARAARRALLLGGVLCVLGVSGPLSGRMALQNLALTGYGIVLPVAAALLVRVFRATPAGDVTRA